MKTASRLVLGILCGSLALATWAAGKGGLRNDLPLVVSPRMIQLGCTTCEYVTFHTDIPLTLVDTGTIALYINGSEFTLQEPDTFADARGNLVVQFDFATIKTVLTAPSDSFTLSFEYAAEEDTVVFDETVTVTVR